MWSYYLLLRHFRPWPAVMEKLCDELKAWSDCLSVPVAWLSMNWVCHGLFSSPLDGSRSIWFLNFFSLPTLCYWVLVCKGVVHNCKTVWTSCNWNLHSVRFYWKSIYLSHVTERVNRQANCGSNYRRALISNFAGIFSRCHFNIDWKRMRDRMGYCSRHQSHHVLIVCKIIFNMNLYYWFFAQKKKKIWMEQKKKPVGFWHYIKLRGLNCTKKNEKGVKNNIKSMQIFRIQ